MNSQSEGVAAKLLTFFRCSTGRRPLLLDPPVCSDVVFSTEINSPKYTVATVDREYIQSIILKDIINQ